MIVLDETLKDIVETAKHLEKQARKVVKNISADFKKLGRSD